MKTTKTSEASSGGRRGPSKLVTLQQASEEYGPPYTSLRDLVLEGHLKRVPLGNSCRIWVRRSDLEKLVNGGRLTMAPIDIKEVKRIINELYEELDSLNGQVLYEPDVQRVLEWAGIAHGRTPRRQEPQP